MKALLRLILILGIVFAATKIGIFLAPDSNGVNMIPLIALIAIPFGLYFISLPQISMFWILYYGLICGVIFGWLSFPHFYEDALFRVLPFSQKWFPDFPIFQLFAYIGLYSLAMVALCGLSFHLKRCVTSKRLPKTAEQGAAANP